MLLNMRKAHKKTGKSVPTTQHLQPRNIHPGARMQNRNLKRFGQKTVARVPLGINGINVQSFEDDEDMASREAKTPANSKLVKPNKTALKIQTKDLNHLRGHTNRTLDLPFIESQNQNRNSSAHMVSRNIGSHFNRQRQHSRQNNQDLGFNNFFEDHNHQQLFSPSQFSAHYNSSESSQKAFDSLPQHRGNKKSHMNTPRTRTSHMNRDGF